MAEFNKGYYRRQGKAECIQLLVAELKAEIAAKEALFLMQPVDITILWESELKIATWQRAIGLIKGENK